MSPVNSLLLSSAFLAALAKAQSTFPATPLAEKHYKYPDEIVSGLGAVGRTYDR